MLWEIMLNSDRDRADYMLLAAQALFDPILLATPSELTVRYLRCAYPKNKVNYDFFAGCAWADQWRLMNNNFNQKFSYDFDLLLSKTRPFRLLSKNLEKVLENREHSDEMVGLATEYVSKIHAALCDDLRSWEVDDLTAKVVILYTFLFLIILADLDGTEVQQFWKEKGFFGNLQHQQITGVFVDYPEIFRCGPILEMAKMATLQYQVGPTNRGVLHDGMHMVYAPYVTSILSNDEAFLKLAEACPFYRGRVQHLSEVRFTDIELPLKEYPNDQKLRNL